MGIVSDIAENKGIREWIQCVPGTGICIRLFTSYIHPLNFPGGSEGKSICLQCGRPGFDPWVRKILLEKEMATHSRQPTPVVLPGKSHGWMEEPGRL